MFELKNLTIGYHKPLVSNINLSFQAGQMIVVYGCNGSGKSTLLKTLTGLISPLDGEIYFRQNSILSLPIKERSALMSFCLTQQYMENLTVKELIEFTQSAVEGQKADYYHILDSLKLLPLLNENIHNLSDGQRQKAMIVRSLAQNTPSVYLDEPTAFLDFKNKKELMIYLKENIVPSNRLVIINTHDAEWLDYAPDQIIGIKDNSAFSLPNHYSWSQITKEVY